MFVLVFKKILLCLCVWAMSLKLPYQKCFWSDIFLTIYIEEWNECHVQCIVSWGTTVLIFANVLLICCSSFSLSICSTEFSFIRINYFILAGLMRENAGRILFWIETCSIRTHLRRIYRKKKTLFAETTMPSCVFFPRRSTKISLRLLFLNIELWKGSRHFRYTICTKFPRD